MIFVYISMLLKRDFYLISFFHGVWGGFIFFMKQVVVVRGDLKMSIGKVAVQACHACLGSYKKTDYNKIKIWEAEGEKKVIVKVNNLEELIEIKKIAEKNNVSEYIVKDAGKTEIPSNTITCLGIGPDDEKAIDKMTQKLKLL
jgi:PTH2 family peptidyl-tRNA hydrolase